MSKNQTEIRPYHFSDTAISELDYFLSEMIREPEGSIFYLIEIAEERDNKTERDYEAIFFYQLWMEQKILLDDGLVIDADYGARIPRTEHRFEGIMLTKKGRKFQIDGGYAGEKKRHDFSETQRIERAIKQSSFWFTGSVIPWLAFATSILALIVSLLKQ